MPSLSLAIPYNVMLSFSLEIHGFVIEMGPWIIVSSSSVDYAVQTLKRVRGTTLQVCVRRGEGEDIVNNVKSSIECSF